MQWLVVLTSNQSSHSTSTQLENTFSKSATKKLWKSLTWKVYLFNGMKLKIDAKIFHTLFSIWITFSPPSIELKDSLRNWFILRAASQCYWKSYFFLNVDCVIIEICLRSWIKSLNEDLNFRSLHENLYNPVIHEIILSAYYIR